MTTAAVLGLLVAAMVLLAPAPATSRLDELSPRDRPSISRIARLKDALPGQRKQERARSKRRAIEVATGLAAAVEAGLAPRAALVDVVADLHADARSDQVVLAAVVAAARAGEDVSAALLSSAAPHWRVIGVAWRVGEESGAAFAPVLDRVAEALRTEEKIAREAAIALATARSTSKLLAVLPVAGIFLGKGIGGDPLGFLFGGPAGFVCLAIGLTLEVCGLLWTRRLLTRAGGG